MGERKPIVWGIIRKGGGGVAMGGCDRGGNGVGQGGEDVDSEWNVRGLVLDSSRSLGMTGEKGGEWLGCSTLRLRSRHGASSTG